MTTRRATKETTVTVTLDAAEPSASTTDPFFDHMLTTLGRYAGLGINVKVASHDGLGHHAVEDAALALGRALRTRADLGPVTRFGHAVVAMDDALVAVTLDVGGRAYFDGPLPDAMMEHALRSLAFEAGFTLHVEVRRGREKHHVVESAFKGLGLCLAHALAPADETRSTKGDVRYGG